MLDKIVELGLKSLLSYYPSERITLAEALKGKTVVRLDDGSEIEIPRNIAEALGKSVPIYLWDLVKLPIIITKSGNSGEFVVEDYKWNREALKIVLNEEEVSVLRVGEVENLLRRFGTAIFINLSVSISNSQEDSGIDEQDVI
jgi:uncharacterized protein (UPF0216 family)